MSDPSLPLVLAGPILRRVQPDSVTVWIALRDAAWVTLGVHRYDSFGTAVPVDGLTGSEQTVRIGHRLHVVAVTAKANLDVLSPGITYGYDLSVNGSSILILEHLGRDTVLSYSDFGGPTFCMPPVALTDLRIVHASCRKPHGPGIDALAALDDMIEESADEPLHRPHQLFLTGDQIYADDVADVLLKIIIDLIPKLFEGWSEVEEWTGNIVPFGPGQRQTLVDMLSSKAAGSHLISFAEFCIMYLLVWSPALWPFPLPSEAETYGHEIDEPLQENFYHGIEQITLFRQALPKVRKALANIPTYMMFDDHEVTDDWFITRDWCKKALSTDLGYRIIRNGMLAYAIFQGWGNRPWDFERSGTNLTSGGRFFNKVEEMCNPAISQNERVVLGWEIGRYLGLPEDDLSVTWSSYEESLDTNRVLPRSNEALNFHYDYNGPNYVVLVLDTRTRRHYPGWLRCPPALLSENAIEEQVPMVPSDKEVTFVISPSPVLGVDWIDTAQLATSSPMLKFLDYVADPEAWRGQESVQHILLGRLAALGSIGDSGRIQNKVIFLSGDVHYSFAASVRLWGRQVLTGNGEAANVDAVFVQFTSSASKNQQIAEVRTLLEVVGYSFFPDSALTSGWVIWNNPRGDIITMGTRHGDEFGSDDAPFIRKNYTDSEPGVNYANWHQLLRIQFVRDTPIVLAPGSVLSIERMNDLPTRDQELLEELEKGGKHYRLYRSRKWKTDDLILYNNIGEITIVNEGGQLIAIQDLWWKLEEDTERGSVRRRYPYTRYRVPLTSPLEEPPPLLHQTL